MKMCGRYGLGGVLMLVGLLLGVGIGAEAERAVYDKLPVKEVTIFKDGHAYVLHEGQMATDSRGNVLLDTLPNPVMGTFWAYSVQPGAALTSVMSSRQDLDVEKTSASLEDLVKGNVGKSVLIKEVNKNESYQATILRILEQAAAEEAPSSAAARYGNAYYAPQPVVPQNPIVLLKAAEGIRALPINQIQTVTFLDEVNDTVRRKQKKDTLTLQLDWKGREPESRAAVGMAYVQRGIRWIPSYRVDIDGSGKAVLKLQACIINELADLNDVKTHLVIGVPTFAFKEVVDPISFQEAVASLSGHFRSDNRTAYSFSNAIMSQQAMYPYESRSEPSPSGEQLNLGPELEGTEKTEDLFVFTVDHITLKKGQRLVMPLAEFTLSYEDVYRVDISFAPPLEMRQNFNNDQQLMLAKLFHAPHAVHKIRLKNDSEYPLTTAPATILKEGRVLAQGMMTYTAIGNKGDLELTTAVNIGVKSSNEQTNQTPNAVNWNGHSFSKIDMRGTIELTNFSDKPVTLEVRRSVLGSMDEGSHDAVVRQLGNGYDEYAFEDGQPVWWNWCSWPWWWYRFNTVGQGNWTVELEPGKTTTLEYKWHYFWG
ncbi:MAG TPA: hypothetical protein PKB02_12400 [Anaerohalosphaeraceae bacterium]|nr:hypothetical protein [Anaerohalosphaeraceae bacterium]